MTDGGQADDHLFLSSRPRVRASANVVDIDDFSVPNEYYGDLYVGSELQPFKVSYDTMSDWTVVSDRFDLFQSNSSKPVNDEDGTQIIASV